MASPLPGSEGWIGQALKQFGLAGALSLLMFLAYREQSVRMLEVVQNNTTAIVQLNQTVMELRRENERMHGIRDAPGAFGR
ncbi:MAG: hypothetical protein U0821_18665 [Chloroflexota bacterium]